MTSAGYVTFPVVEMTKTLIQLGKKSARKWSCVRGGGGGGA